jgi:hypothetical protein
MLPTVTKNHFSNSRLSPVDRIGNISLIAYNAGNIVKNNFQQCIKPFIKIIYYPKMAFFYDNFVTAVPFRADSITGL